MKDFPLYKIIWLSAAILALASGLAVVAAYLFEMTRLFLGISYAVYAVMALISMALSWKYGYGERQMTVQQRADVLVRIIITLLASGVMSVVLSADAFTWLAVLPGAIVISLSVVLLVLLKRSIFGVTKTS